MDKDLAIKIFEQCDIEADVGGCENCPRHDDPFHICPGCLNAAKDTLLNYITNLQKENEELQRNHLTINENNQNMQEEMVRTWEKCNDYKSKNEKAVEYLKYQISNLDFEKDIKARMLGAMAIVILEGGDE